MNLFGHNNSAGYQAEAVLAYIRFMNNSGIEKSWNPDGSYYTARVEVANWYNGREQGYVIYMRGKGLAADQLNIAFYEHRNSDSICAIKWEQNTGLNPPQWGMPGVEEAMAEQGVYKDKYDVSHQVRVGQALEMAEWILEQLNEFWDKTSADHEMIIAHRKQMLAEGKSPFTPMTKKEG